VAVGWPGVRSADQLAVGAVVAVNGPDGQEWGDGATTVSGATVTQRLGDGLPAGDFQVACAPCPVTATLSTGPSASPLRRRLKARAHLSRRPSVPTKGRHRPGRLQRDARTPGPARRCHRPWAHPATRGPPSARRRCRGT